MNHPGHEVIRHLLDGKVVDIEGLLFVVEDGEIEPGVMYVGTRNSVDIYTCREVNNEGGWINPEGIGYPFDLGECVRVREADGATADYVVPLECIAGRKQVAK